MVPHKRSRKSTAQRARHAANQRAYRKRQRDSLALFYVAVEGTTYDLMEKFGGLDPKKVDDKNAVRAALGRLLRAGLNALLELEALKLRDRSRLPTASKPKLAA